MGRIIVQRHRMRTGAIALFVATSFQQTVRVVDVDSDALDASDLRAVVLFPPASFEITEGFPRRLPDLQCWADSGPRKRIRHVSANQGRRSRLDFGVELSQLPYERVLPASLGTIVSHEPVTMRAEAVDASIEDGLFEAGAIQVAVARRLTIARAFNRGLLTFRPQALEASLR